MAVRFDNATERLSRTAGLPSFDSNYTAMAWVYVVTHPGTGNGACVFCLDDQTDDVDEFYLDGASASNLRIAMVTLVGGSGAVDYGSGTFAAGTWQHVAIVRSANNLRTGYRNGVAELTHTRTLSGRTAPTSMTVGSVLDSDLLNGRVAHVRIWTAALSQAEIQAEMNSATPVRTANLHLATPLPTHTDLADTSGNGRNWTAVGTLSTEAGPTLAGSHALTATGITTGAPSVAAATLGQVHGLTAGAITTAAPTVAAPALSQAHALAAANVAAGAPALTAPQLLPHLGATVGGVLEADATNGRYFANNAGPLVLAGFHTWYNLQDGGATNPPPAFGWADYLTALVAKGANFLKLWRLEATRHWPSDAGQYFGIQPWQRTGPGNAADGAPKFDLTAFNQDYFDRLRVRCIEAGNAGIYVAVQLFQGFHIDNTKPGGGVGDPWAYHPFNSANNVNSVNGDIDGDGIGDDARSTSNTAAYNAQKAYVEKVIDTLNDLDNVIFEIENEGGTYAETWQKALIDYIHIYEAGKSKQHPVGMTKIYPSGTNSMLTSSNAEWISPDEDLTPAAQNDTGRVWTYDTDHTVGTTTEYKWVWRALCQGYGGLWYMDVWDSDATGAGDTTGDPTYERIRANLGYALGIAAQVDLAAATPAPSLASTGYALANTMQIVAYQDTSGSFTVNLTGFSGVYAVEWLRTTNGATQAGSNVNGGATRTLTPPWAGEDAVALLALAGHDLTATGITTGAPSVGAPTITQVHGLAAAGIVAGAPSVAATTIGQVHALAAAGIVAGAPVAGAPAIAHIHVLAALDIAIGAPVVDAPAIGQAHALAAGDVATGNPALDTPVLAHVHVLVAAGVATGAPTLDAPAIGQTHALSAAGVTAGAPTLGAPSMGGEIALFAADVVTGAPVLDAPTVGQVHALAAGAVTTGAPGLGAAALAQVHALTAVGIVAGQPTLGAPSMAGETALGADGITAGAPTLDAAVLSQAHALQAAGIAAGAADVGAPAIGQIHVLVALAIVTGAAVVGSAALNRSDVTTPAERTFVVRAVNRTFVIEAVDRVFRIRK